MSDIKDKVYLEYQKSNVLYRKYRRDSIITQQFRSLGQKVLKSIYVNKYNFWSTIIYRKWDIYICIKVYKVEN